ncbi:MAG: glycoside hydrolase family 2 [Bacteroidales bacterium]|nr:glycoside hydrolase family 2 [Bacteroidales bacterium]
MKRQTFVFSVFLLLFFFALNGAAQKPQVRWMYLWNGLRNTQPENELPKGNAPFQIPEKNTKKNIPTRFIPVSDSEWIISDGWELASSTQVIENNKSIFDPEFDTSDWLNATVPGTVLTTLVEQGIYPDPYFGLNNLAIPDTLCRMEWWYRSVFEIPDSLKENTLRLLFNGINYRAEVFLNGKKLGNIDGAFIRGEFDINQKINKEGKNILAVRIIPPSNPGIPHEQSMVAGQGLNGGQLCLDGPTFISSEGWDWVPGIRDRNIGIWQDVRLLAGSEVQLSDPQVISELNDPKYDEARITIHTYIKNTSSQPVSGIISAKIGETEVKKEYTLAANEIRQISLKPEEYSQLILSNPLLWWPNGYGPQNLYEVELKVFTNKNELSDSKQIRFGIRELSYELMVNTPEKGNQRIAYSPVKTLKEGKPVFNYLDRVYYDNENQLPTLYNDVDTSGLQELSNEDPAGPYLVIRVNGTRIFCRGGNWGMDDAMKRVSRERMEPYLKLHQEANFNIIRNWTGESTEEIFYELCDEYGMLVWNDFWITTENSNVDPNDQRLFLKNAEDVVRRFRNHPSIAIWCPRNEGFAPKGLEHPLAEMIAREDPTRHYHGQSRYLNMKGSGPWNYFKDPSLYYTSNAQGFNTEMGCHAIPTHRTLEKFIAPEDRWPINDVWAYHDLHHTSQAFEDFMSAVNRYGNPTGYVDFCRKAQFVTYDAWRDMLEAWNSKMWDDCTGLILWMSHPAWPSMIWQTYTYDYETPGSYFGAKKACEPIHIQMNLPDNEVVVINTTRNSLSSMTAMVHYYDLQGKELYKKQIKTDIPANSKTSCFFPERKPDLPSIYLARVELKDPKGKIVSLNDYWKTEGRPESYEELSKTPQSSLKISFLPTKKDNKVVVHVQNTSDVPAIAIKLNAVEKSSGEIILPAYFGEGYFNLLPNEKRSVELILPSENKEYSIIAEAFNSEQ